MPLHKTTLGLSAALMAACAAAALAAPYQPSAAVMDVARRLIDQDLTMALSGGKSVIGGTRGLVTSDARAVAIDYLRNEVAANEMFRGKLTALRGQAMSIRAGYAEPFIEFAHSGEWGVRAYFAPTDTHELAKLRRLDQVEVVCKGAGVTIGVPVFKNCVMASAWRQATAAKATEDVMEFFKSRPAPPEAALVAATAIAIAADIPSNVDCSAGDGPCDVALAAFAALPDREQKARIERAARRLAQNGLRTRTSP
ncbi:hypothetical protein CAL14_08350 [Bordetella genomosp. 9]|uniref:OB-fold protein n=1 Tax=Bordetella genomosp. 9 TaxID=1416803 RepID=UPI000A296533|nr:hypothetical protein [Bordetella genomosp. 9]ARP90294.1 hypothetical protein CAL14_08350 [Bordetella genomosp. 9]